MQPIKVYSNKEVLATQDKELIERYKSFNVNGAIFGDTPEFKQELVAFCNEIRESAGINNVISFHYDEKQETLLILTYDVFANQGLTYQQGFDETGPYMMLAMQEHS